MNEPWGVDAALGAVSIVARTTTSVANAASKSAPVKAAFSLTRRLAAPLVREGAQVRDRIGVEAGPTTQRVIDQAVPVVLDMVSIDMILTKIDIDALLDRIDVSSIIARIDMNEVVGRIDIDGILSTIDLNALMESIDLNALMESIDLDAVVGNTEIGSLIARSTSGIASEALDTVRSQGVGLDNFVARLVAHVVRRDPADRPEGPPMLVADHAPAHDVVNGSRNGNGAGNVSAAGNGDRP